MLEFDVPQSPPAFRPAYQPVQLLTDAGAETGALTAMSAADAVDATPKTAAARTANCKRHTIFPFKFSSNSPAKYRLDR